MSIAEELRKLDQEWEAEQQAYLIQGSHNNSARIPTRAASIIGGVLVGGMGGFWMVTAFSMIPGDGSSPAFFHGPVCYSFSRVCITPSQESSKPVGTRQGSNATGSVAAS